MAPPKVDRLGDPLYKQVPAYCSPNASRTQRSGVTDVKYMIRPDREYWPVCFDSNPHTHMHAATSPSTSPLGPAQRVQVCAAAARRRVGRRHRDVPRQPDGAHRAVRPQLRRVRRPVHQQAVRDVSLGRQVLARAAHPGHAASAALERRRAGHRLPLGRRCATSMRPANPSTAGRRSTASSSRTDIDTPIAPRNCSCCRTQTATPAMPALRARHRPLPVAALSAGSRTASRRRRLPPAARRGRATRWSARASTCRATPTWTASAAAEVRCDSNTSTALLHSLSGAPPSFQLIPSRACTTCARTTLRLYSTAALARTRTRRRWRATCAQGRRRAAPQHLAARQRKRGLLPARHARYPSCASNTSSRTHAPHTPPPACASAQHFCRRRQVRHPARARACAPTRTTTTCTRGATSLGARSTVASAAAGRKAHPRATSCAASWSTLTRTTCTAWASRAQPDLPARARGGVDASTASSSSASRAGTRLTAWTSATTMRASAHSAGCPRRRRARSATRRARTTSASRSSMPSGPCARHQHALRLAASASTRSRASARRATRMPPCSPLSPLPAAPDNCAGVHDAQARVDRQPAQRAAGVLRARHHDDDPRQGGRGADRPDRDHVNSAHRPHQQCSGPSRTPIQAQDPGCGSRAV